MAVVTSQQIRNYYDNYKSRVITFTKEINATLGLLTNQIFLKFKEGQRPCVLYSSSLEEARIIVSLDKDNLTVIKENQSHVSLRLAFRNTEKGEPISFFIQAKLTGLNLYNKEKNLFFANLSYTQRPPDDMIEILGLLLEATANAEKRREERIILTADNIRKLNLMSKNAKVMIQNVPRNVIIRDLSFSGAKIIILGNAKFLMEKEIEVSLVLLNGKNISVKGKIVRFEPVEGRKDIAALAIQYDEGAVPLDYKLLINTYLQQTH